MADNDNDLPITGAPTPPPSPAPTAEAIPTSTPSVQGEPVGTTATVDQSVSAPATSGGSTSSTLPLALAPSPAPSPTTASTTTQVTQNSPQFSQLLETIVAEGEATTTLSEDELAQLQATTDARVRAELLGSRATPNQPTQTDDTERSVVDQPDPVDAQGYSASAQAAEASTEALDVLTRANLFASGQTTNTFDTEGGKGPAPHYFKERAYQVYHHDVIVFIQGTDVSEWLEGTVQVSYGMNSESNSCTVTLNNAYHRFVLTPENMSGRWRLSDDHSEHAEYDESAKKRIFDIKNPIDNNPVDPKSGGRMWPLDYWSPIFHKMDPIRVWVRNPLDPEADQFLPLFTGYVASVEVPNDYIRHESSITLTCHDLRMLMQKMRTNTNSVLWVQPGQVLTETATQYQGGARVPVGGGAFDPNFFQDLVVVNEQFENPWANMNMWQVIESLTYGNYSPVTRAPAGMVDRRRDLLDDREALVAQRATFPEGSPNRQDLENQLRTIDEELARIANRGAAPTNASQSGDPSSQNASGGAAQPPAAPAQASSANSPPTPNHVRLAPSPRGRGRIGRMRMGKVYIYPKLEALRNITDDADTPDDDNLPEDEARRRGSEAMSTWNNIIVFGYPNRRLSGAPVSARNVARNNDSGVEGLDAVIDQDTATCTYWTWAQVAEAGKWTRSNRAWAPDVQQVHVLKPKVGSTGEVVINDNTYINSQAVNTQLNWTTRLDLLSEVCAFADYRFYITPSGDLVFEFPQYDFYPSDYNSADANSGWQDVYEFWQDLLHDSYTPEANDITTAVIVVGGLTGYSQFATAGANQELAPETQPHAVCYSPVLTGRHGANVVAISRPLEQNEAKLARLAVLEMQRSLGNANAYSMDTAYRPWVGLNRPLYNRVYQRYGLTDSVTHIVPVRESAGPAQTSYQLTFPRNLDQFGVPRFITGGASLPVYFGAVPRGAGTGSIRANLQQRHERLSALLSITEDAPRAAARAEYLQHYRAPYPEGYDFVNVVLMATSVAEALAEAQGATDSVAVLRSQASALQADIVRLQEDRNLSNSQRAELIAETEARLRTFNAELRTLDANTTNTDGDTPEFGATGIRTPNQRGLPEPGSPERTSQVCDLDPYRWSSPLGRRGTEWPRRIVRSFSTNHQGVDYDATEGETVYAIGVGRVVEIGLHPNYGRFIKILHEDYYLSVYAPVQPSVSASTVVLRNQPIGAVISSPESARGAVLHFALGQFIR